MGKAVGYIIALVVIVVVIYVVATHGKNAAPGKPGATGPVPVVASMNEVTYATMKTRALDFRKQDEASRANLPAGMTAPPVETSVPMDLSKTIKDKGTIISTEEPNGRGAISVDVDGDGQPDVKLDLGGMALPANLTAGETVEFSASVKAETMPVGSDKLMVNAEATPQTIKVVGAGAAAPATAPAAK